MFDRPAFLRALLLLTTSVFHAFPASTPDFSKEAVVLEKLSSVIHYSADGSSDSTMTAVIDVQSDAAVRQFGVLAFSYSEANQRTELTYVRVRKKDGSVVETPVSSAMDVPSDVAKAAPMYSDTHEKQIPVKSLAAGDVLEYGLHTVTFKPEVEGQFWLSYNFDHDVVVREETMDVYVPQSKFVKVSSPRYQPSTADEGSNRHYSWKFSHLEPTNADPKKQEKTEPQPADIQLTTFRSWDEIGHWYAGLMATQTVVTPAIAAKASELTKNLTTPEEKARAIYDFVASKFRYVSISFGLGRYQPHTAAEVLENAYGDCKDKHTLFAALLQAAGIKTSTVLIGDGLAFDADLPSPAQFNHVITALPEGQQVKWADTTSEVAPFGLLMGDIRDHKALLIDSAGKISIVTTPAEAPFAQRQSILVDSSLDANGVLTGHFDLSFRGDVEAMFRAIFRQIAPVQWAAALQNISYGLGFAGDISNPSLENIDNLDNPLHITYDYKRTGYSDWNDHRISPPLPPISLPLATDAEKPIEPIKLAGVGEIKFRAVLRLPKQYTLEPPKDVTLTNSYAAYQARYSLKDGVLTADRSLKTFKSSLPVSDWEVYKKLATAISDDHGNLMQLVDASLPKESGNPKAAELIETARKEMMAGNLTDAREHLKQAEAIEPKQRDLWFLTAFFSANVDRDPNRAIAELKRELGLYPDHEGAAFTLSNMQAVTKDSAGAISTLQDFLLHVPHDITALEMLSELLDKAGRQEEVVALLKPELDHSPDNLRIRSTMVRALLRLNRNDEALPMAKEVATKASDPLVLNNVAYWLADDGGDLELARKCAQSAIERLQGKLSKVDLDTVEETDFRNMDLLAASWDTLGWVYFKLGDLAQSETYLKAAWELSERGDVGDHLGQLYMKKGDRPAAIRMWRLAMAAGPQNAEAVEKKLKAAGASSAPVPSYAGKIKIMISPGEELTTTRTKPLPTLQGERGSGDYLLLFANSKLVTTKLLTGNSDSPETQAALQSLPSVPFPDNGPERIVRRGILSCSKYTTPNCEIVLLQSGATHRFDPLTAPPNQISHR